MFENRIAVSVSEAGKMLGLRSRDAAYKQVKSGLIPTVRHGNRLFVPIEKLKQRFEELSDGRVGK